MTGSPHLIQYFVFTINNPTQQPSEVWDSLKSKAKYLIFQKEKGDNGTLHFQGYCELDRRSRFSSIKALLPTAHIEPRRGTQEQARDYASKQDTRVEGPFEFGVFEPRSVGQRSDLAAFRDAIKEGKRKRDLLEDHLGVVARYPRLYDTISYSIKRQRRLDLNVLLYWGVPGSGKTRAAWDFDPDAYVIPISDSLWFDGYDGQKTLILDDFTGWMKLDHLLRLLDIYPVQVQVKGGFTWLEATTIIVTSNSHFRDWYDWSKHGDCKYAALERRFREIKEFTNTITSQWLIPEQEDTLEPDPTQQLEDMGVLDDLL